MRGVLAVACVAAMVASVLAVGIGRSAAFNEVTEPWVYDYEQPILDSIFGFQNLSFQGRPFAADPRNGDLYLAGGPHLLDVWKYNITTGEFTELWDDWTATGDLDVIKCGYVTDDGHIFVGRDHNSTVYRSTDGGVTFEAVLVMQSGAYAWDIVGVDGRIYTGEYGNPGGSTAKVYMTGNDGEDWTTVMDSHTDDGAFYQHVHRVAVDPYTGYIYVTVGDGQTELHRSTDGESFPEWSTQARHTAIEFDAGNIYFGDDPKGRVYVYNKTTDEYSMTYLGYYPESSPVYDLTRGDSGVLYARTFDDSCTLNEAGIWCSPDGHNWGMIWNLTCYGVDVAIKQINGADGYIYQGIHFGSIGLRYNVWFWRMNDISVAEAWAAIAQEGPRPTGDTYTFDGGIKGANGTFSYASFQQDVITDAQLDLTGVGNINLFDDGTLDTVKSLNVTWDGEGYSQLTFYGAQNYTRKFVSGISHTGPYSIELKTFNRSRTEKTGGLMLQRTIPVGLRMPAGTPLTISGWFSFGHGNLSSPYYGGGVLGSTYLVYNDASSEYLGFLGGPGDGAMGCSGGCQGDDISFGRRWFIWSAPNPSKVVYEIKWTFNLYGNCTMYMDDLQAQWGIYYTPTIAEDTSEVSSEDINVTVNGVNYDVGTLDDGVSTSVELGTVAGLQSLGWDIAGSECVNWTITGTRSASVYDALLGMENGVVVATHLYDASANIAFWNDGAFIDPASFLDPDDRSGVTFRIAPGNGASVNATFSQWGVSHMAWAASASDGVAAVYSFSGLDSYRSYDLFVDEAKLGSYRSDGSGALVISYSGWSSHYFVLEPSDSGYDPVQASFTYIMVGGVVYFTDTSYGNPTQWVWNFGDGFGSTYQSPSHRYARSGDYLVSLTATDAEGQSSVAQGTVSIVLSADNPVERDDEGWLVFISPELTLSVPALALFLTGALSLASATFVPDMPLITARGRRVIGVLCIGASVYFFLFGS